MAQHKNHFIIIDDSKLDCFIAEKIIKNTGKCDSVTAFQDARDAIAYIKTNRTDEHAPTVILVDIQMPVMNGFEFVEEFEKLPTNITCNYTLYIISSSINDNDLNRVHNYSSVKQFLNKPLNSNNLAILLQ
jgi:CheY-like chemotaxis protein